MSVAHTHTIIDSPVGPLTLVRDDDRLCGLYMETQRHRPVPATFGERVDTGFEASAEQLAAYFAGELTDFELDLAPAGTPFQQTVWAALRTIPYGETVSYGELAEMIGKPSAARAVGLANGRNPISIVVPCHRVVGANGDLTGYGGGLPRKQYLLEHERQVVAA